MELHRTGWKLTAHLQLVGLRFRGFNHFQGTQKKVLTDVFKKGDKWFRTGDLLRRDEYGFYYFVDRIGDTFRTSAIIFDFIMGTTAHAPLFGSFTDG